MLIVRFMLPLYVSMKSSLICRTFGLISPELLSILLFLFKFVKQFILEAEISWFP